MGVLNVRCIVCITHVKFLSTIKRRLGALFENKYESGLS